MKTILVTSKENHKLTHDIRSQKHHILADEPEVLGGQDLGMSPYELLLSALGACTAMTIRMYADLKGIPLTKVKVELTHDKVNAEDYKKGETQSGKIDKIQKRITLEGDFTTEQHERMLSIAERCPVNRTLHSEIWTESLP